MMNAIREIKDANNTNRVLALYLREMLGHGTREESAATMGMSVESWEGVKDQVGSMVVDLRPPNPACDLCDLAFAPKEGVGFWIPKDPKEELHMVESSPGGTGGSGHLCARCIASVWRLKDSLDAHEEGQGAEEPCDV